MKKWIYRFAIIGLLLLNWILCSLHAGVFPAPKNVRLSAAPVKGEWIDKSRFGMNQIILTGSPFERGRQSGELTRELLRKQEIELVARLHHFFPNEFLIQGLVLVAINWFEGIEKYLEPWAVEEMYGVSLSAPHEFDYLSDGLTRQVAYHGLHEVGQMMVDQKGDDMGCTILATPYKNSWIVGRNFDFEAGRIFDSEKIVKWVFPDEGNSYVSVIWAGMVGGVTGVNDHGLFIAINAAGSKDFRRYGTPSTLVLIKALQFSKNIDEALAIFKKETMFITDIFVLLDAQTGKMFRIEKSPDHTEITELSSPVVVTNHLQSPLWQNDQINLFRKNELTSTFREVRGLELIQKLDHEKIQDPLKIDERILEGLRDKGGYHLGNRRAIDGMIATHAVIYDGVDQTLFVSQGFGVSGAFTGFDLQASFRAHTPIEVARLPRDPLVSDDFFTQNHWTALELALVEKEIHSHACAEAQERLAAVAKVFKEQYGYYTALGDLLACQNKMTDAKVAWQTALNMKPAYAREIKSLQEKLTQ